MTIDKKEIFMVLAINRNVGIKFLHTGEVVDVDISQSGGESFSPIGLIFVFDSRQEAEAYSQGRYEIITGEAIIENITQQ